MLVIVVMAISLFAAAIVRSTDALPRRTPQANRAHIIREVRHELRMLPYYGVFDWLEFEVRGDNTVLLRGQVVRPTTKSEAEARVREIDGVARVINEIQALPVSPQDDRLRIAVYRTLFNWDSPLFRYATQSVPSIHIVVDHGRATLKGIVDSSADAQLAYIRARGVPGLFDVKNELQVESEMPK